MDWRKNEAARWCARISIFTKVEFFRGVNNPIGVKVSDKITDEQFLHLVRKLNP